MSETLRDLVVSLSLQTDNFTRNIRSVQQADRRSGEPIPPRRRGRGGLRAHSADRADCAAVHARSGGSRSSSRPSRSTSARSPPPTTSCRSAIARQGGLRPAPHRRQSRPGGAQGTGGRRRAAGARYSLQRWATATPPPSPPRANLDALKTEYRASVQEVRKARRTEHGAAKERAERRRRGEYSRHEPEQRPRSRQEHAGGDRPAAISLCVWHRRIGTRRDRPSTRAALPSPPSASRSPWPRAASSSPPWASKSWIPASRGLRPNRRCSPKSSICSAGASRSTRRPCRAQRNS